MKRWGVPRASSERRGSRLPKLIAMGALALWTLGAGVGTQESGVSGYFDVADYGATPCDLVDDTVFIQDAINAAAVNHAPVWIGAGEWLISGQIRLKSGTSIQGAGADVTVIKSLSTHGPGNQLAVLGDSSITIADLTLDGNMTERDTFIVGLKIQGSSTTRATDIRVLNCTFRDHQNAIDCGTVGTAENVLIQGCNFVTQSATTARTSKSIQMQETARNWRISYCDVTGGLANTTGGAGGGSAMALDGIGVTVSNVTIHDYAHGFSVAGIPAGIGMWVDPGSRNVVISSCTFDNVAGDNMSIRGGGVAVSNCSIRYSRDQGIVIEGDGTRIGLVTVTGCTIDSTRAAGIRVINARDVTISGNTIKNTAALLSLGPAVSAGAKAGVSLFNTAASESVLMVSVTDNLIIGDADSLKYGIYLGGAAGVVDSIFVAQNTIVDADTLFGGGSFPGNLIDGSMWVGHRSIQNPANPDTLWGVVGGTPKELVP